MKLDDDKPEREADQEDILATALFLSQNNPTLTGMSAKSWVEDAVFQRARIRAITGVYHMDDDAIIEELSK